jgi:hypothetical protein
MNTIFTSVHLDASGTLAGLHGCFKAAIENGAQGLLLLIGSSSSVDLEALPEAFRMLPIPSVGAVFPGVIYEEKSYTDGVVVCGLASPSAAYVIPDITRSEQVLKRDINTIIGSTVNVSSLLLVIDGLSRGVDNFAAALHDYMGPNVKVLGAGCGYLDFSSRPNIVISEGLLSDAALIYCNPMPLVTSVRHGWERVEGPFLVTEASDNFIHQINYQQALPFYMGIVERHLGYPVEIDHFSKIANHYPFGLEQLDSEFLVRDLVQHVGHSIMLAGAVPTNAMVYLLHASCDSLINAAGSAAACLRDHYSTRYASEKRLKVFVIDCISRQMVLGNDFRIELANIRRNLPSGVGMVGVLSIGEIASSNQGGIHWLNKTTVIGGLAE